MKKYLQSYCEVNMFNIQFLKPEEKSSNRIEKNKIRISQNKHLDREASN